MKEWETEEIEQLRDHDNYYKNNCFHCGSDINEVICEKSKIPNMGYVCHTCGKDLTEWKFYKYYNKKNLNV